MQAVTGRSTRGASWRRSTLARPVPVLARLPPHFAYHMPSRCCRTPPPWQLVDLLRFYLSFPIHDHTGDPLGEEEVTAAHYERVQQLQRLFFKHVPKLRELALANCGTGEWCTGRSCWHPGSPGTVERASRKRAALSAAPTPPALALPSAFTPASEPACAHGRRSREARGAAQRAGGADPRGAQVSCHAPAQVRRAGRALHCQQCRAASNLCWCALGCVAGLRCHTTAAARLRTNKPRPSPQAGV